MTFTDFCARLENVKFSKGGTYCRAVVPGSGSKDRNLAAWEKDGWIWFTDHTKKRSKEEILGVLGLEIPDLKTVENGATKYVYKDEKNKPLFKKIISRNAEGKKIVRQQGASGESDLSHLNGQSKVLYRLPDVLSAVKEGKRIYICEGEAACVRIFKEWGHLATCQPSGADAIGSKWLPQHTEWLTGAADVVIVADRDEVGEGYAKTVYAALFGKVGKLKVVSSAGLDDKADAEDHILADFGEEDFILRPDLMPEPKTLKVETFTGDFVPSKIEFLIEPYLPKGKCVLLDADGGTGKTALSAAIAASLTRGDIPITGGKCEPVKVLYLHKGEDTSAEIQTVAKANGAVDEMILYYQGALDLDEEGIALIEATLIKHNIRLIIFDALFYFLVSLMEDTNSNLAAMAVMERLNGLAQRTGVTIINIRHTVKGQVGVKAENLGMGSVQFRNSHRGQLVARFHPDRKQYAGVVVVTDEKGSILVPRGEPFAFRRVGLEIQYLKEFDNPFDPGAAAEGTPKVKEAKQFLMNRAYGQYIPKRVLWAEAEVKGITRATFDRAKKELLESKALVEKYSSNGRTEIHWGILDENGGIYDPEQDE